jgi:plastocyanin
MIFMKRRALPLAAAAMLVFGIGAYAGAAAPSAVTIANFAFSPAPLKVAPGTTVTWTNKDEEPHTVTSADGGKMFKSEALDTDDKFSFTFDKSGTFKYFCSIHPNMVGTVVVQ